MGDREPTIHLSRIDWEKEQRGERTERGDVKQAIKTRNTERETGEYQHQYENEYDFER